MLIVKMLELFNGYIYLVYLNIIVALAAKGFSREQEKSFPKNKN